MRVASRPARAPVLSCLACLSCLWLAGFAHADPSRELIVHLARPPAAARRADAARPPAALDTLALAPARRLDQDLPLLPAVAKSEPGPFDLDPSRVWLVTVRDTARARAALRADPEVIWVEPNRVRDAAVLPPGFPSDPLFNDSRQWGLLNLGPDGAMGGLAGADIHARDAWTLSVGSGDVRLAVADTGVDPAHPELQAPLAGGGWRMTLGVNVTGEPPAAVADTFGHGTPVAGVMAARTHEGPHADSLGMAGVCGGDGLANPGCRLVPIKITAGRTGGATSFDIARAMFYATAVGARAMNLSFAGLGSSRIERLAMHHAITHGCVVVAAAGNRGYLDGDRPQYPAAYAADGLGIQVGASDPWDRRANWSSYGPGLDVLAPGVDIWSCLVTYPIPDRPPHPPYLALSGTSFAAPFVTGTVGLLAARRPELMDTDFQYVVRESADDLATPGRDPETGWGRLNAAAALAAVDPSLGIWHDEVAGQRFVSAGFDTLRIDEPGPGALERITGPLRVERIEVTATVTVPDSFRTPVRVWPRVGGTFTGRGDARLPYWTPWAEVVSRDDRSFTLRGYLFRATDPGCAACAAEPWLPLPPDQARFGFTVLGPVERGPEVGVPEPAPVEARISAHPNPFRTTTLIRGPAGATFAIVDVAGRMVRRGVLDGRMGGYRWDGLDARGRRVRPGLYLVRCDRAAGARIARVVRLD